MPEGVEVEFYRQAAQATIGRQINKVVTPDSWFLKAGTTAEAVSEALLGEHFIAARRIGKLMILDVSSGTGLGLRFGMTGRIVVDGVAPIEYLEYSSKREDPAWIRLIVGFEGGGDMRLSDPRRLGAVLLDPDEEALGVDVFAIRPKELRERVLVGEVSIKARLLDQKRVAGIGNLIVDETLWRAGIDPARAAGAVNEKEAKRLLAQLRSVLKEFLADGGSHTGRLQESRVRGGLCPKDGVELLRRQIGGRTTFSCPRHQPSSR